MNLRKHLILLAKLFFILVVTSNSVAANNTNNHLKNDRLGSILNGYNHYIEQTFNRWQLPGLAIAVVDQSGIRYIKTLGVKKVGEHNSIDKNTIFRIASLSKALTSTLAFKVLKENNISLDKAFYRVVPDFKTADPKFRNVSIRNILSHTSGLSNDLYADLIESNFSYNELKNRLTKVPKIETPGKRYAYQNFIYSLAGEAVSNITGRAYEDVLAEKIFKPLQMYNSSAGAESFLNNSNKALPHVFSNLKFYNSPKKLISTYYTVSPAGGVNSSIQDMGRWLHAQYGGTKILSARDVSELTKPIIPYGEKNRNLLWKQKRYKGSYYALGWRKMNYAHKSIVLHGGVLHGYTNIIAYLPEEKVGIVILSNANTPVPGFLMARFFDTFLNLDLHDYNNIEYAKLVKASIKPKVTKTVKITTKTKSKKTATLLKTTKQTKITKTKKK